VLANSIAAPSPIACRQLELYLHKLRYVKSILGGDDLRRMGFAPGPGIRETLEQLRDGRLDKKLTTRQDEEAFVINRRDKPTEPD
jgi:tRNA nucleotidyltransferase (CCA-adding enzyme)